MAKPIFIIEMGFSPGSPEKCREIVDNFQRKLEDYHVLMNFNGKASETTYKMFSDKDIEPIEIEKLKEILKING